VKTGILGSIASVALASASFDIYAQIGLVVLIALAAIAASPIGIFVIPLLYITAERARERLSRRTGD
jgi:hypothetical protein